MTESPKPYTKSASNVIVYSLGPIYWPPEKSKPTTLGRHFSVLLFPGVLPGEITSNKPPSREKASRIAFSFLSKDSIHLTDVNPALASKGSIGSSLEFSVVIHDSEVSQLPVLLGFPLYGRVFPVRVIV